MRKTTWPTCVGAFLHLEVIGAQPIALYLYAWLHVQPGLSSYVLLFCDNKLRRQEPQQQLHQLIENHPEGGRGLGRHLSQNLVIGCQVTLQNRKPQPAGTSLLGVRQFPTSVEDETLDFPQWRQQQDELEIDKRNASIWNNTNVRTAQANPAQSASPTCQLLPGNISET